MRQFGRWHRKRGRTPIKADQKSRLPAFLRSEKRMFTSAGSSVWLLEPQDVHEMAISLCRHARQIAGRSTNAHQHFIYPIRNLSLAHLAMINYRNGRVLGAAIFANQAALDRSERSRSNRNDSPAERSQRNCTLVNLRQVFPEKPIIDDTSPKRRQSPQVSTTAWLFLRFHGSSTCPS
jgi:hypothetical protein